MSLSFALPSITENGATPVWVGNGFQIGNELTKVLQYSSNIRGWNDDLTFFHEESAGDQHFIDRASRDHAIQQIRKHLPNPENATLLEIGCSSGFMLKRLSKAFPKSTILGSDVVSQPLHKLAETLPNIPLFRFDLLHCPFPDNSIDAVVILNVLEHIENDLAALQQIKRILKPGGIAIIEVPAGPHLYDIYDKVLMHYRRYTRSDLTTLATKCDLKIKDNTHLGFFLYPGFRFVKKRNQKLLSASLEIQQQHVQKNIRDTGENKLFHALMQTELLLGRLISYPVGIRCLMTCKK
ncbi:MAG: class I SAM-dependent methyltransferase [Gammaproteobacteria bacterium]